jgi:hypothetical protein
MSLITNKSNLYICNPNSKYTDSSSDWSKFMEEDFTIFLRSKILIDEIDSKNDGYMISRSGKHAGISTHKDDESKIKITFIYWFWQKNIKHEKDGEVYYDEPTAIYKTVSYHLLPEEKYEYNDYIMQCDHSNRKILCYINGNLIGEIDYTNLDKNVYTEQYMWLGCGNMITEHTEHRHVGAYEYDLFFCLDKVMDLDTIYDIKDNYKEKYTTNYLDLLILNDNIPFKNNIYFFLNFTKKTMYKLWNSSFNGYFPNLYIENNTQF